jgi:hypothetical protein
LDVASKRSALGAHFSFQAEQGVRVRAKKLGRNNEPRKLKTMRAIARKIVGLTVGCVFALSLISNLQAESY